MFRPPSAADPKFDGKVIHDLSMTGIGMWAALRCFAAL
jgi:hypothetical protein